MSIMERPTRPWDESKVRRGPDGKFGSKGGGEVTRPERPKKTGPSAKKHAKPKRAGGEKRGNSKDRRARKRWMLKEWGDGESCPCVHCEVPLYFETVEADRIIPGSQGGSYRRENIQPSCRACNLARSDDVEWEASITIAKADDFDESKVKRDKDGKFSRTEGRGAKSGDTSSSDVVDALLGPKRSKEPETPQYRTFIKAKHKEWDYPIPPATEEFLGVLDRTRRSFPGTDITLTDPPQGSRVGTFSVRIEDGRTGDVYEGLWMGMELRSITRNGELLRLGRVGVSYTADPRDFMGLVRRGVTGPDGNLYVPSLTRSAEAGTNIAKWVNITGSDSAVPDLYAVYPAEAVADLEAAWDEEEQTFKATRTFGGDRVMSLRSSLYYSLSDNTSGPGTLQALADDKFDVYATSSIGRLFTDILRLTDVVEGTSSLRDALDSMTLDGPMAEPFEELVRDVTDIADELGVFASGDITPADVAERLKTLSPDEMFGKDELHTGWRTVETDTSGTSVRVRRSYEDLHVEVVTPEGRSYRGEGETFADALAGAEAEHMLKQARQLSNDATNLYSSRWALRTGRAWVDEAKASNHLAMEQVAQALKEDDPRAINRTFELAYEHADSNYNRSLTIAREVERYKDVVSRNRIADGGVDVDELMLELSHLRNANDLMSGAYGFMRALGGESTELGRALTMTMQSLVTPARQRIADEFEGDYDKMAEELEKRLAVTFTPENVMGFAVDGNREALVTAIASLSALNQSHLMSLVHGHRLEDERLERALTLADDDDLSTAPQSWRDADSHFGMDTDEREDYATKTSQKYQVQRDVGQELMRLAEEDPDFDAVLDKHYKSWMGERFDRVATQAGTTNPRDILANEWTGMTDIEFYTIMGTNHTSYDVEALWEHLRDSEDGASWRKLGTGREADEVFVEYGGEGWRDRANEVAKASLDRRLIDKAMRDTYDFPEEVSFSERNAIYNAGRLNPKRVFADATARRVVSSWASSAADSDDLSLSVQWAATQVFETVGMEETLNDFAAACAGGNDRHAVSATVERYQKEGDLLEGTVRAMYNNTQKKLKEQGISEVTLLRGMKWRGDEPVPEWATGQHALQTDGFMDAVGGTNVGLRANLHLNPLSSWSTDPDIAKQFSSTSTRGILLATTVPAEQVFSTAMTGNGCLNESEFVLKGGWSTPIEGGLRWLSA